MCWVQGLLVAIMQVKKSTFMTQYFLYAAVVCFVCFVEGLQARSLKGGVLL